MEQPAPPSEGIAPDLLRDLIEGSRGRALRAQLAARHPERPAEDVEEAVQAAIADLLAEGEGITDPGAAYAWLRTAAHRILGHEAERRRREVAVDPTTEALEGRAPTEGGPAEDLLAAEEEGEMAAVVHELLASFDPRRRQVFALWASGARRPEIAAELGLRERVVKRELLEMMEEGRRALIGRTGGGCEEGEPLVTRLLCGLAAETEAARARLHLERCERCSTFAGQMEEWRQKAGVLLPVPAVEAASPGLLGRAFGRAGEAVSSARRAVFGGGAQARERVAAAGYARAGADPTPLAGIRPGAVAAVVAGCLAVGTGATYCAGHGLGPLSAAEGLIGLTQEGSREEPEPQESTAEAPSVAPVETAPLEEGPVYGTETAPQEKEQEREPEATAPKSEPGKTEEPATQSEPRPEPEPEPEPEEVTPPPEQAFEPASPDYPATEADGTSSSSSGSSSSSTTGSSAAEPRAVPANEAPQFGGP